MSHTFARTFQCFRPQQTRSESLPTIAETTAAVMLLNARKVIKQTYLLSKAYPAHTAAEMKQEQKKCFRRTVMFQKKKNMYHVVF